MLSGSCLPTTRYSPRAANYEIITVIPNGNDKIALPTSMKFLIANRMHATFLITSKGKPAEGSTCEVQHRDKVPKVNLRTPL